MIEIKNLTKRYSKSEHKALDNVSFKVNQGEILGLLGHNGAGKTTLMNIMTGLMEPSGGEVYIDGVKVCRENLDKIRKLVGYMPQHTGCYSDFTVEECLDYFGILNKIESKTRKKRVSNIMEYVNLTDQRKKKFKNLSGGMQRRLGLGIALINDPKVLIVDEPTTGVDPNERIRMRNLIMDLSETKTILLSTHIIEDISYTCDNLALLSGGNLKFNGKIENMMRMVSDCVWEYNTSDSTRIKDLSKQYTVLGVKNYENHKAIKLYSKEKPFSECSLIEPTLEDSFVILDSIDGELR